MRGFVELTTFGDKKVLLPVGGFEVWEGEKTGIQPINSSGEMGWSCKESYEQVKELIYLAQEPEQERSLSHER